MKANTTCPWILFLVGMFVGLIGCHSLGPGPNSPYFKSFYEKARLIMTEDEMKIYNSLPDADSKREFIEEFWKMRDPDPSTEENENKIEFERRVTFANEWFGDWKTFAGRSMGEGEEKDRGWKTARGRVYIILGPPGMVSYDMGWGPMRLYRNNRSNSETWYYRQYDLYVYFYKRIPEFWRRDHAGELDKGEPYVREWDYEVSPSTLLIYAMEDAKLNMINPEYRGAFIKTFQFRADYDEGFIILEIPIDRVLFEEREGRLHSDLDVEITVYRDHKKIDRIVEKKTCDFSENEILAVNEIVVKIPYRVKKKDIICSILSSRISIHYMGQNTGPS